MNRTKKLLKKMIAVATGSSLIIAGGTTVFAAGSYQDTEKSALEKANSSIKSSWADYLDNYKKAQEGSKADITLTVEDTGRALLGALSGGSDFSWLKNISLNTDVSIKDSIEALTSSLLLNDSQLCNMNVYMDLAGLAEYIQIPEISEGYIKAPISAASDSGDSISTEALQNYMNMLSDLSSVLPDEDVLTTLINRYGTLVIDNMEEGPSGDESLSVEGISEDCTVYEGQVSAENITSMAKEILTTAKDDKEIKGLFDSWTGGEDQYQEFQTSVDDLLETLNDDSSESGEDILYSKVWVNKDDKIVGREVGTGDGVNTTPIFTWKCLSDNDSSALLLDVQADDSAVTFTGSGTSSNGILTGDYILALDGTEAVDVHVDNLETKPEKPGYYNGKFTLTFPEGTDTESDTSATNALTGFAAELTLTSDVETETSSMDLTVTTSGAPIATLTISGGYGEGTDVPDLSGFKDVYTADNDTEMAEYLAAVNWDTLADNATKAGVPEELVTQLRSVLESAVANASGSETDTAEDAAAEETAENTDAAA